MNSVPFDAREASTPSTRGGNASTASTERAAHLEVRKTSEITLSHAGEIDFEEFLLVIKNMQNPGADSEHEMGFNLTWSRRSRCRVASMASS